MCNLQIFIILSSVTEFSSSGEEFLALTPVKGIDFMPKLTVFLLPATDGTIKAFVWKLGT